MSIRSTIGLAAALTLGTITACLAEKARVPKIDVHKICREIDTATQSFYSKGSAGTISSCIASEREAHGQIVREWHSFPASARSLCIKPDQYMPTYLHWLTCLETTRDVMKMRKGQTAAGLSNARSTPSARR
jgi:hypothetical protein